MMTICPKCNHIRQASEHVPDWQCPPGSAGPSPLGKKYLVGATLKYRSGGEDQTLDVSRPHSSLGKKTPDEAYAVMLPSVKLAV